MIVPCIIGVVLLGRAFDIFDMSSSTFQIFDTNDINSNLQITSTEKIDLKYKVIEKSSDAVDFLTLDPVFALKVRQGSYRLPLPYFTVPRSMNRFTSLEIFFYAYYETETHTFPPTVKQLTAWKDKSQEEVGTHFIRGIQYGGEMLMTFTIKAFETEYMPEIKKIVTNFIGSSGVIDLNLPGKLEQMNEALKGKAFTSFQCDASGISAQPINLQDGIKVALQIQEEIKNSKGGKGSPIRLILEDLHSLQADFKPYQRNPALNPVLKEAYEKYDDVAMAKEAYQQFENEHSYIVWTHEQADKLDDFYGKVSDVRKAMANAIIDLDVSGSEHQFDEAFKMYGEGENKHQVELQELIRAVLKKENS